MFVYIKGGIISIFIFDGGQRPTGQWHIYPLSQMMMNGQKSEDEGYEVADNANGGCSTGSEGRHKSLENQVGQLKGDLPCFLGEWKVTV